MSSSTRKKKTILFLAANPKSTTQLRLEQEVKEIGEGLQRSQKRDKFRLEKVSAITPKDLRRAMLDYEPQIIHFSGHGVGESGLVLEDDAGHPQLVSGESLAQLFRLFAQSCQIECVILNACYSEVQANAIAQHIPYVIGMQQAIGDKAAREFAVGFYDALGAGKTIEFAYSYGCTSIAIEGIPEELTPVFKQQPQTAIENPPEPVPEKQQAPSIDPIDDQRKFTPIDPVLPPKPLPEPPQSRLKLERPEGQVPLDSQFYVERPPIEQECYETIEQDGELIRIKAPRQMGKSSLMQRVLSHAKQQGHRTVYLNFQSADSDCFNSLDSFLQWFCVSVSKKLELENRLSEYWKDEYAGFKPRCTDYFEQYLLETVNEPITLGLDEVDRIFEHQSVAGDFFGLLRNWHEIAKNDDPWHKLRLVIAHSQEVYIPLKINESPFNVGFAVELPELTEAQVRDLVERHQLNWTSTEVEQLMSVVDGHPYLLRKALYEIARGTWSLTKLMQTAPTEQGLFGDHLQRHLKNLKDNPELEAGMRQIVSSSEAVDLRLDVKFKLRSMGLVELQGNGVVPLCNLYRMYFRDRLGVS